MEAKDLMVGDWVRIGKNKKLRCHNILGHADDVMLEDGVVTNVMNLNPVPITADILAKNGFAHIRLLVFYDKSHQILLTREEGFQNIYKNLDVFHWEFEYNDSIIVLSYVHELQHAIRLCGIDKEIEL